MKIKTVTLGLVAMIAMVSCNKEYETETLAGHNLSGEWFVQTYFGGTAPSNLVLGYEKILTSNTAAANGSQIWVDDLGHIWPFKVKVSANASSNTFSGTNENIAQAPDSTFVYETTIIDGRIFPGGGRSATGVKVDSIYFKATFNEDPGNEYIMAGHYRTGFIEDEL